MIYADIGLHWRDKRLGVVASTSMDFVDAV